MNQRIEIPKQRRKFARKNPVLKRIEKQTSPPSEQEKLRADQTPCNVRLPNDLMLMIDTDARRWYCTRSAAIRRVISNYYRREDAE